MIAKASHQICIAHPDCLFIGGAWIDTIKGGRIEVISAHSEEVIAVVAEAIEADMDEIFGPVLSVIPVDDEADAIRAANDSSFGLYGAVLTRDRDAAYRVARAMRTGTVTHNIFRFDPFLPFGGFKQLGIGREGGVESITSYTELKSILLDAPA
jgi:aldehyde dehydrogenase (NAD+)